MLMKVLIADEVDPLAASKLRAAGFEVTEDFDITLDELKADIKDYDALV